MPGLALRAAVFTRSAALTAAERRFRVRTRSLVVRGPARRFVAAAQRPVAPIERIVGARFDLAGFAALARGVRAARRVLVVRPCGGRTTRALGSPTRLAIGAVRGGAGFGAAFVATYRAFRARSAGSALLARDVARLERAAAIVAVPRCRGFVLAATRIGG